MTETSRVLVTGAGGFIGHHLVTTWAQNQVFTVQQGATHPAEETGLLGPALWTDANLRISIHPHVRFHNNPFFKQSQTILPQDADFDQSQTVPDAVSLRVRKRNDSACSGLNLQFSPP